MEVGACGNSTGRSAASSIPVPFDAKTKRREPLLTFKRGAVVHFAMSDSEIQMATKLDGENTLFLPFNKGNDGHAGNPEGEKKEDGTREYPVPAIDGIILDGT